MGTDLVTQMSLMTGIEMAAIATRRPHTALDAMTIAYGEDSRGREADTPAQATAAIEAGKIAITSRRNPGHHPQYRRRHRRHRQARRRRRL